MTLFARIPAGSMLLVHRSARRVATANMGGKIAWVFLLLLVLCVSCDLQPTLDPAAGQPTPIDPVESITIVPSPTAVQPLATTPPRAPRPSPYPMPPDDLPQARVVKVVDGDTIDVDLDGTTVRLRLIGINTPETVDPRRSVECYGQEASTRAHKLLDGQTIWLEGDPSQQSRDRYDRLLRYVWLPDERMYNLEMITQGYAYEYTYSLPYKYQQIFKQAEQAARDQERGLWSPATCAGQRNPIPATPTPAQPAQPAASAPDSASYPCTPGQIKANRNSRIYHVPGQRNYANTWRNVECFDTETQAQNAGYRRAQR